MRVLAAVPLLALALAGCGKKQIALPGDPVDRAATCGVVAAAKARMAVTDIKAPLPFDAQLGVIHYAMLAGIDDKGYAIERASATSQRMADLADKVTSEKWQTLEQPCAAAFPATVKADAKLPASQSQQELQCFALADFLQTALQTSLGSYGEETTQVNGLRRDLDAKVGVHFSAKGQTEAEDQKATRFKALATVAEAGPPAAILKQCLAKFPPKTS